MSTRVEIDGVNKGIFNGSSFKSTIKGELAGIFYAPYLLRFDGLTNTSHKVVLTATAMQEGKRRRCMWLQWIQAIDGNRHNVPSVYVGNYLSSIGNNIAARLYSRAVTDCVETISGDGLNITLVDTFSSVNAATDFYPDGSLNDLGHQHIADAFLAAITPESIAEAHTSNIRGELYYIFLRTWNIESQQLVVGGTSAGLREMKSLSQWRLDLYKEAFRSGKAVIYERK